MERRSRTIRAKCDRLSSLPDSLLCRILSFLPTKRSVATSILARRWRFLWRDVDNLDFNSANHKKRSVHEMSFADIISMVMLLNVRDINRFRLTLMDGRFDKAHLLEIWIRTTIARNVQALDIRLLHQVPLPHCLFTCKTLVDLSLYNCGSIPDAIFLPNLKRLHLHGFQYDKKLQNLFSGCPVLEELNILTFNEYDLKHCTISSPTIKWLTLDFYGSSHRDEDYKLVINTPAVRYLALEDITSQYISAGIFNSLVEANICLDNEEGTQDVLYSISVLELVDKLCHVKCLKLRIDYNKFLDSSFAAATSKFINLTRLEMAADWLFLLKFLESADNLQVLIIKEVEGESLKRWMEPQEVPTCLSSHLRQVTIDYFECLEVEFEMISYILRNCKVLNMMKIYARHLGSDLEKLSALRRISEFERGSETCKLQFS